MDENGRLPTACDRMLIAALARSNVSRMTQIPYHTRMEALAFLDHLDINLSPKMAQFQIPDSLGTGDLGLIGPKESRTRGINGGMEDVDSVMVPTIELIT